MSKFKDLCLDCCNAHAMIGTQPSCLTPINSAAEELQYKNSLVKTHGTNGHKITIRGTCDDREKAMSALTLDFDYDVKKTAYKDIENYATLHRGVNDGAEDEWADYVMDMWNRPISLGPPTKEELDALEDLVIKAINNGQGKKSKGQIGAGLTAGTQKDRITIFALFLSCYTGNEIANILARNTTHVYKQLTSVMNSIGKDLLRLCQPSKVKSVNFNTAARLNIIGSRIKKRKKLENVFREFQPYTLHLADGRAQKVLKHYSKNWIVQLIGDPVIGTGVIYASPETMWEVVNGKIVQEYKTIKKTGVVKQAPYKNKDGASLKKDLSAAQFKSKWLAAMEVEGDTDE